MTKATEAQRDQKCCPHK